MLLYLEHIGNMIYLVDCDGTIFKSWYKYSYTKRKLKNALKKIHENHPEKVQINVVERMRIK